MPLDGRSKRELKSRGHALKPQVVLAEQDVSEGAISQIRALFATRDLIKVRVATDSRDVCAAVLRQVVGRAPCELIQRVGRVALLYHPRADNDECKAPVDEA